MDHFFVTYYMTKQQKETDLRILRKVVDFSTCTKVKNIPGFTELYI